MVKDANNMIYYKILKTINVLYYVDFCNFMFINCEYQMMIVMFYRNLVHEREREREREYHSLESSASSLCHFNYGW